MESNWFSAPSALRVYGQYLNLDRDQNGMLSKQELSRYGTGTLTKVFIDRVFQECLTYEGEMVNFTFLISLYLIKIIKNSKNFYVFLFISLHRITRPI